MKFFRGLAIGVTQVPLLYFELGRYDMLGGFNQTDAGFGLLIGLFFVVPLLNLGWLIYETTRAITLARETSLSRAVALPFLALVVLLESLVIDLYLLSHARM